MEEEHRKRSRLYGVIKGKIGFLWLAITVFTLFSEGISNCSDGEGLGAYEPNVNENLRNQTHG